MPWNTYCQKNLKKGFGYLCLPNSAKRKKNQIEKRNITQEEQAEMTRLYQSENADGMESFIKRWHKTNSKIGVDNVEI